MRSVPLGVSCSANVTEVRWLAGSFKASMYLLILYILALSVNESGVLKSPNITAYFSFLFSSVF